MRGQTTQDDRDLLGEVGDEIRVVIDRWSVGQLGPVDLLAAGIVFAIGAVIAWLASRAARRYAGRFDGARRTAIATAGLTLGAVVMLVAAALALEVLGFGLGPVLVLLFGVIVIVLLTRPLVTNLSSGLLLQLRAALDVGDLIRTNGHLGTVREVNSRSVVLDAPDGRRIHIPNTDVASGEIENFSSRQYRRSSFEFTVAAASDVPSLLDTIAAALEGCGESSDTHGDEPDTSGSECRPSADVDATELVGQFVVVRASIWHGPTTAEQRSAVSTAICATIEACADEGVVLDGPQIAWPGHGDPPDVEAARRDG